MNVFSNYSKNYSAGFRIRPIQHSDATSVMSMYQSTSSSSLYMRYLRHHMPDREELGELCDLPPEKAKGLVAVTSTHAHEIVGIAHYVIDENEPEIAEPAILIEDRMQFRGIGSTMFLALSELAVTDGVRVFEGVVSGNNRAIIGMLKKCDLTFSTEYSYGVFDVRIRLPQPQYLLSDSA